MTRVNRDEQGFILATAILAMVVVGAAEAGIQRVYAEWSIRDRWTMNGGTTAPIGPYALPTARPIEGP